MSLIIFLPLSQILCATEVGELPHAVRLLLQLHPAAVPAFAATFVAKGNHIVRNKLCEKGGEERGRD